MVRFDFLSGDVNVHDIIGENTAQSAASNFYLGFMKGSGNGGIVFVVTNFSNVSYNISFEYTGNTYTIRGNVSKGSPPYFTDLRLGSIVEVSSNTFEDRFKSFQVQSDKPISVTLLGGARVSSEFLVLPCHQYSNINRYEYYTVSTSSYSNTTFSEALIIGCRNSTNVTITPSVDLFLPIDAQLNGSRDTLVIANSSHTLVLHEGQTLLIGSRGGADISGTHIISNKPITVITGHECGSTPDMIANNACFYMHLQVPPTVTWGKKFILSDFTSIYDNVNLDYTEYVKLITSQDDTMVTTDCNGTTSSIKYHKSGAVGTYEFNIFT
uniref:IgGFc-binding protein N-terminal domain-containing protein n=1 Tax=Amphimedon queenslandica TaxID=400682 RepID=A0A1X7SFT5_AMPQE